MQPTSTKPRTPSWRRTALIGSTALFALAFTACGSSSADKGAASTTTTTDTKASANEVTLKLIAIHPASLSVAAGTTVTWKQLDPGVHTVTSGTVEQGAAGVTPKPDGQFDSGELKTGKTFTHTFSKPGTYTYFCKIHPATMRGEVTVR